MGEKEELLEQVTKAKNLYREAHDYLYGISGSYQVLDCYQILSFYKAWLYGGEFLFRVDEHTVYQGIAPHNDRLIEYHKEITYRKYRITRSIEDRINSASDYNRLKKEIHDIYWKLRFIKGVSIQIERIATKVIGDIYVSDYMESEFAYFIDDMIKENSAFDTGEEVTKEINVYQGRY